MPTVESKESVRHTTARSSAKNVHQKDIRSPRPRLLETTSRSQAYVPATKTRTIHYAAHVEDPARDFT